MASSRSAITWKCAPPTGPPVSSLTTPCSPGKVEAALVADKRTSAMRVDIESHDGEVQLSGFAKSQGEKDAAVAVAKTVEGVRIVKNDIDVR